MPPAHVAGKQAASVTQLGLPYLLALPALWNPAQSWPLLIYLHGAGESGTDPKELLSQGATGTPPMLAESPIRFDRSVDHPIRSLIVASPQTDAGWIGKRMANKVVGLLDELLSMKLGVDAKRVYLTGVSMGGAGTFSIATLHSHRWAAVVPVCGAPPDDPRWAHRLRQKPLWIWHGANDVVMPVDYSDQAADALRAVGAKALQYTRLENAPAPFGWPHYQGHAAWIPTYAADSALWPWLAQQVLSASDQEVSGNI
jgi:predicted peptidase